MTPEDAQHLHRLHEDILHVATQEKPAQEAIVEICLLTQSLLPESVATVLLLDESGLLQPYAAPSVPKEAVDRLRDLAPGPEAGSCGNAVLREEPVYVCDTLHDERWGLLHAFAEDFGILACWSNPIKGLHQQAIGSFALSSFLHRAPGLFERLILDTAAHAIGQILRREILIRQRNLQVHALESINEGILITDAQQRVVWANAAFSTISGYTTEEMIGKNCRILQGPETKQDTRQEMARHIASGEVFRGEVQNYRKDGTPFWNALTISPVLDAGGKIVNFVGVQRDVTLRKAQEHESQIAATAFEVDEGILITDAERRIIRVNQTFTRLTGYSETEVFGKTPEILQSGRQDHTFYESMWQEILKKGSWKGEIWNRRKNGEIFPEWLTITAVKDQDGKHINYVAHFQDISDRKEKEEQLRVLALYDPLTELPNRTLFAQTVAEALVGRDNAKKRSGGKFIAVGLLDLDGFKEVNDTLGHDAGDLLLKKLGEKFLMRTRTDEIMARLGGDEFGFVVWVSSLAELEQLSERLLGLVRAIGQQFSDVPISGSLGWAVAPDDGNNYNALLAHADEAMYAAKEAGKSTYRFYHGAVQAHAEMRLAVHRKIPLGIVRGDIDFFLQPQLDLAEAKIDGAELLVRWRQADGRWLFPGKFIGFVEEDSHLTRSLGIYALMRAGEMRDQLRANGKTLTLSVNIGAKHFLHPEFLHDVQDFCPDGNGLQIEITETVALHDLQRAQRIAETLKNMGFLLSLDDFGSGYASLQYLTELPFDEIKLDQSFTRKISQCMDCLAVTSAAVLIAQLSGRNLIAEGVSNPKQLRLLLRLGVRRVQGYFLAPPLPINAFLTWGSWLFLPATEIPPVVPPEHLALLMLESEDYHWRKRVQMAICPVTQWVTRAEPKLGNHPDFQTIAKLHPLLHLDEAKNPTEMRKILAQLQAASERLLAGL